MKLSAKQTLAKLKRVPVSEETLLKMLEKETSDVVLRAVEELFCSNFTDPSQKISAARLLLEHKAALEAQEIHVTIN